MVSIKQFFHWKGAFSQGELFLTIVGGYFLILGIGFMQDYVKEYSWAEDLGLLMFPIILFYGVAVGKRFRDTGSSAWYGIAGVLIPIIGFAMLFIPGEKSKPKKSDAALRGSGADEEA